PQSPDCHTLHFPIRRSRRCSARSRYPSQREDGPPGRKPSGLGARWMTPAQTLRQLTRCLRFASTPTEPGCAIPDHLLRLATPAVLTVPLVQCCRAPPPRRCEHRETGRLEL